MMRKLVTGVRAAHLEPITSSTAKDFGSRHHHVVCEGRPYCGSQHLGRQWFGLGPHTEKLLASDDDQKGNDCTASTQDIRRKEAEKPLDTHNRKYQQCTYVADPEQQSVYELEGKLRINYDDFFLANDWQPFGEF